MDSPTFKDLGLSPKVYEAVVASGYTVPTPIQAQAIPVAITGQDVLGIAQTGTGKTASFTLPMITRLETGRARARMPRSLILAPTRELAAQVAEAFERYGVNHKLNVALLIGGVSFVDQDRKIDRGVDVLIATPGRLLDHFQRGKLLLNAVEILVIDEADRMLDMGFIPDIEKICKLLPPRRQTLFFSATMPPEIQRLVDQFLNTPVQIEVARPATTAKTITQRFQFCPDGDDWAKREILRELIRAENVRNAIIFCNRKRDVAILHKSLLKHGFNAGALHGDMDQKSRMETLDKFRNGEILFLAASDVAARGLDIPDVSHVFNFDVPGQADDYVHRIGRTGRAGREGCASTLVTVEDLKKIGEIEKITGEAPIWIGDPPTEEDFANAGRRRRGGRSSGSSSSSRDGSRDRGRSRSSSSGSSSRGRRGSSREREEVQADAEVAQPVEATATPPSEEKGGRQRRRSQNTRSEQQSQPERAPREREKAPARAASPSTSDSGNGRRSRRRSDTGGPNAFQEDTIPAFLQRPVRRAKPAAASSATSDDEAGNDAPANEVACD